MSGDVPEGWRPGRVSDLVAEVTVRTDPRSLSDPDTPYLGLEDIGQGTGTIIAVGRAGDATSQKSRFAAGDILFGKLRPNLRKVARPDFDGICSTDISVFRAKPKVDSDFAFRVLASDPVIEHAVSHSAGTKMPRAHARSILSFETLLPPLDEQRQIAEVLRSVDESASLAKRTVDQHLSLWESLADDLIWRPAMEDNALLAPLGHSIKASDYGVNAPLHEQPDGIAVLRMGNIQQGQIDLTNLKWGQIGEVEAAALKLRDGDILFNRTNSRDLVGKVAFVRGEPDYLYASYLVRLSIDRSIADPYFVFSAMNSRRGQASVQTIATPGVSQSNINPTNLKKLLFPRFTLERQREIAILLQDVEASWLGAKHEVERLRALRVSVSSQLLCGRVRVPA